MAIEDEYQGEYTERDVRAWRDGDWIVTELAGRVIARRLTRDPAFITVRVQFSSVRSPRYARKDEHLQGVEVRVQGARPYSSRANNFIDVPIRTSRDSEEFIK